MSGDADCSNVVLVVVLSLQSPVWSSSGKSRMDIQLCSFIERDCKFGGEGGVGAERFTQSATE